MAEFPVTKTQTAWMAFWLSLLVPGAGQLAAGSPTAFGWFLASAWVGAFGIFAAVDVESHIIRWSIGLVQLAALFALGLASGLHARRCCLSRGRLPTRTLQSEVTCSPLHGRRVRLGLQIATQLSAEDLWRRISDLPAFLTIDPFHERVVLMRPRPAAGVQLVLDHNVFGVRLRRLGRILSWREGAGYSISDLSRRGGWVGFPHVFFFRIEADETAAPQEKSLLHVEIRGKWTARMIPLWLARWWLSAVCREHTRLLADAL